MSLVPPLSVSSPLVGRTVQMRLLADAVAAAAAGRTGVVLLGGEAGVGKSRLVSELATDLPPDTLVLTGQCIDLGGRGVPYAPLVAGLRALVVELGPEVVARAAGPGRADLARLLPELGRATKESDVGRGRLFEAVASVLERAATPRTVVLVVEDMHWADESTREMLGFLVRSLHDVRVLVLLTYRTDELHRRHPLRRFLAETERGARVQRIQLDRLDRPDVRSMLRHLLGHDPTPDQLDDVCTRTEGVPFFVEELVELGVEPGRPLPDSVRDLLLVRLDTLPEQTLNLLRVAAVGGAHVSHDLLTRVTGLPADELDDRLRPAVAAAVLLVDDDRRGYLFRHALLREVLHDDLLPGEHARIHEQWASALEGSASGARSGSVAVEVAHHWYAALDVPRAFTASLRAADETRAMYAPREEMQMLDRVLELWSRVPHPEEQVGADRVSVLTRAAAAAVRAGEPDRVASFLRGAFDAVSRERDPRRYVHLLVKRASYVDELATDQTLADLTEALALSPAEEPSADRAAALVMTAAWHVMRDDWTSARELAEQGLAVARAVGDPKAEANALNTRALAEAGLGEVSAALSSLEQSRHVAEDAGDETGVVRYRTNLSDVLLAQGRYREAAETARAGRAHAEARGLVRSMGTFLAGNEAEALIGLGHWDAALTLVDRALGQDPPPSSSAHLRTQRATVLLLRGDPGAAAAVDSLRSVPARFAGQPQYVLPVARLRAELALGQGNADAAVEALATALESTGGTLHASSAGTVMLTLARALVAAAGEDARGDAETGRLLDRARAGFSRAANPPVWDTVLDAETARLAGRDPEVAWGRAAAVFEDPEVQGPAHVRVYVRLRWAEALVRAGERTSAEAVLGAAAEEARALGAEPLLRSVLGLARRARLAVVGADSVASPADRYGLTPREREVLDLVAAGRSNADIAGSLFISPKTASVHVSNILAKVGAANRAEAAAIAHAAGLVGSGRPA